MNKRTVAWESTRAIRGVSVAIGAIFRSCLVAYAFWGSLTPAFGQQNQQVAPAKAGRLSHVPQRKLSPEAIETVINQSASGATIPLWNYTVQAGDGNTYTGMMVGRSPYAHGHRSTTVKSFLIALIFTFADTGEVFDPTKADACAPNKDSVVNLIVGSPIIASAKFTLNGVDVGTTQYLDAFQRGNFWALVGGTPYHSLFPSNPTVIPVKVTVPMGMGSTKKVTGLCRDYGLVSESWLNGMIQNTIIPGLASKGVDSTTFPQFISDSVATADSPEDETGVALGYHANYFNSANVFQTYSMNSFDTSGEFASSPDLDTMSHEVAEWLDDPDGSNPVPLWGGAGQVNVGVCQGNLEVGDPTSEGGPTPSNQLLVKMPNGYTYTLQELTYFSWFYRQAPSLGSGGKYSDNGAFNGYSKTCPPGGTN